MATIDYKQKIKDYMNSSEVDTLYKSMLNNLFPELAEPEDERIRKAIINIIGDIDGGFKFEKYGILKKDALAWLEKQGDENHISRDTKPRTYVDFYKRLTEPEQEYLQGYIDRVIEKTKELQRQGEQKPVPDWMPKFLDELRSKKNYFDWDEDKDIEGGILAIIKWMNPNYFNGKDSEQNSADNVEPKFNVGDKIISTISNIPYYITEVRNGYYLTDVGCAIMFNAQDNFELSNQNPVRSKEDESRIGNLCHFLEEYGNQYYGCLTLQGTISWLKSLRPQNTWKPSDEQIEALKDALNDAIWQYDFKGSLIKEEVTRKHAEIIESLYNDLKKLREE